MYSSVVYFVALLITDHYHLSSNLVVGMSEGCFIFYFASIPFVYHVHKSGRKTSIIIFRLKQW